MSEARTPRAPNLYRGGMTAKTFGLLVLAGFLSIALGFVLYAFLAYLY